MAITLAQAALGDVAFNVSSISKAFGSNVTNGNLATAGIAQYPERTWTSGNLTKSAGTATIGTPTIDVQVASTTSQQSAAGQFSVPITGSGSLTLAIATASGSYPSIGMLELAGADVGAGRCEDFATGVDNDGGTAVTTADADSAGAAIFVGAVTAYPTGGDAVTWTEDAAFTPIFEFGDTSTGEPAAFAYRIVSGATTDAASWTLSTAVYPWVCTVAVYKAAASIGTAAITGTAGDGTTEALIVAGGQTVVITLTGDVWVVAAGGLFDAQRQNIIDGLDSAQSEATGWNNEVRDNLAVTDVVRTSDTVVTVTLSAQAAYAITALETITVTVPSTATLLNAGAITATPTFTVTPDSTTIVSPGAQQVFGLIGNMSVHPVPDWNR